jgi:hypothetical protein
MVSSLSGCTRGIGDGCETALNCSASASRLCDRTQPGGYCTLAGCQEGSCPDEAVCVTFWRNTDRSEVDRNRLSVNYCMRKCDDRSDCRDDDGYVCVNGDQFGFGKEATVEGHPTQKFCAAESPSTAPRTEPPPVMSEADAGE